MSVISHLLTETITVFARTGLGANGDPAYAAGATLPARVEHGVSLARSYDGETDDRGIVVVTESAIAEDSLVSLQGETATTANAHSIVAQRFSSRPDGSLTLYRTQIE